MLPNFENGVNAYVKAIYTKAVYFPVDKYGVPDICCSRCPYVIKYPKHNICKRTGEEIKLTPNFIGTECPLEFEKEV